MSIFANKNIGAIYVGSTPLKEVYVGSVKIWPATSAEPGIYGTATGPFDAIFNGTDTITVTPDTSGNWFVPWDDTDVLQVDIEVVEDITSIDFSHCHAKVSNIDYGAFFIAANPNLTAITGLSSLDWSEVQDLTELFGENTALTTFDFSGCNFGSDLIGASYMLYGSSITSFSFGSAFDDATNLANVDFMFAETNIEYADMTFLAGKPTSTGFDPFQCTFFNCANLKEVDFSGMNCEGNNPDGCMQMTFSGCTSLERVKVTGCSAATINCLLYGSEDGTQKGSCGLNGASGIVNTWHQVGDYLVP